MTDLTGDEKIAADAIEAVINGDIQQRVPSFERHMIPSGTVHALSQQLGQVVVAALKQAHGT